MSSNTFADNLLIASQVAPLKEISPADLADIYIFHKPGQTESSRGYVSGFSAKHPAHEGESLRHYFRKTGLDGIYPPDEMICFGRLDKDTSGLILISKKGKHPRFLDQVLLNPHFASKSTKLYRAKVNGAVDAAKLEKTESVRISVKDKLTFDAKIESLRFIGVSKDEKERNYSILEIEINEGKHHQVKKMLFALGHKVRRGGLHRLRFGKLTLIAGSGKGAAEMPAGAIRGLFAAEKEYLAALYNEWLAAERIRLAL